MARCAAVSGARRALEAIRLGADARRVTSIFSASPQPPRFSSVSTSLLTALSVSKTPWPVRALAS